MKRAFRALMLACLSLGLGSIETARGVEGPLVLPAPRHATPGQPPRPYRHFDFSQPSPFGVVVTYQSQKTGRTRQVFTYPGYRNQFPEPPFLYYGDPQVRWRPGLDMGAPTW